MTLKSYLGRHQTVRPANEDEMQAMRRAAWQRQGVAVLVVSEILDDWTCQAVINEANRLYGRRKEDAR